VAQLQLALSALTAVVMSSHISSL